MKDFGSHLLARFPGDYECLSNHTAGSLAVKPMTRTMATRTAAGSRGSSIPTQRFAVEADFERLIELRPKLPEPAAVAELPDFDCDVSAACPCNSDRDSGDGVH